MSDFVQEKIRVRPSHPSGLIHSSEDYARLLERIQQEAKRQKAHARAWELAKQQGVKPVQKIEDLRGNFWPEEDSIDEFLAWVSALRGNDKPRSIPE